MCQKMKDGVINCNKIQPVLLNRIAYRGLPLHVFEKRKKANINKEKIMLNMK